MRPPLDSTIWHTMHNPMPTVSTSLRGASVWNMPKTVSWYFGSMPEPSSATANSRAPCLCIRVTVILPCGLPLCRMAFSIRLIRIRRMDCCRTVTGAQFAVARTRMRGGGVISSTIQRAINSDDAIAGAVMPPASSSRESPSRTTPAKTSHRSWPATSVHSVPSNSPHPGERARGIAEGRWAGSVGKQGTSASIRRRDLLFVQSGGALSACDCPSSGNRPRFCGNRGLQK